METQKKLKDNKVDLKTLKFNFAEKYPDHKLTKILLESPDELSAEELLVFVKICLTILKMEVQK